MFNILIKFSLHQRALVLFLALLLVVYGLITLRQLPVDVFPDLNKPTVTLMTEAHGMAPEEVEQRITTPLEVAMNGVEGVTRVRSVSGVGLSIIYVEFAWGSDIYRNRQQVSERLSTLNNQLPTGILPQLSPISSVMGQIMLIAVTAETPEAASPMQLRQLADWVVRPRLLGIHGVSQVMPIGGEVQQYRITPVLANLQRLNVSLGQIQQTVQEFASNTSGGFLDAHAQEYLIRNLAHTTRLEDLQSLVVGQREGVSILLSQVAKVEVAPAPKRGDASFMGQPAVVLSVQKQPNVDTIALTAEIEHALSDLQSSAPKGVNVSHVLFKQVTFIETALGNVRSALQEGAIVVALVVFLFLLNGRTTLISLTAIPLSLLVTALVFQWFGLSVNTMTLGGLAIALGELIDDALVDVENVARRLRQNAALPEPRPVLSVIAAASNEVRSGVVYATLIVVLVFVPLFFLSGIEGRLFSPLGVAYIVSILTSLGVALTVTPVLCYYLLGQGTQRLHGDTTLVRYLKTFNAWVLHAAFRHVRAVSVGAMLVVIGVLVSVPFFQRAFLPPLNEGTLTISVLLQPGISLAESNRVGALAEKLLLHVPEVKQVGRRVGRAELDEHAEGVHSNEIEVELRPSERSREAILADIRARLSVIPASINIGQPISHLLDHMLSGVRAEVALKVFGDDPDTLQGVASTLQQKLVAIQGLVDVQIEKQVRIPQLQIHIDYRKAQQYGVTPASINHTLETLLNGSTLAQVLDNQRRTDVVLRLAETERNANQLNDVLVETPTGFIPLRLIAEVEESSGMNQIMHENGKRRLAVFANTENGADRSAIIQQIQRTLAETELPQGYYTVLEGQFQAQEAASQWIALLALVSLGLIFMVLYSRYQSIVWVLLIMGNIPLALTGGVVALWLTGQPLSIASLVGFITLAGISTRNGILKTSHYLHLVRYEGESFGIPMIIRGSLERLTPVLMTALTATLALIPLLMHGDAAGKEILHPVAVVIFGGLISATVLDTVLTPVWFYRFAEPALLNLVNEGVERENS